MSVSDKIKNRGAHGDSSFMLGGVPSSSENPPDLSVGSVKGLLRVAPGGGRYHDLLIYDRPLTDEELRNYELDYINEVERED